LRKEGRGFVQVRGPGGMAVLRSGDTDFTRWAKIQIHLILREEGSQSKEKSKSRDVRGGGTEG